MNVCFVITLGCVDVSNSKSNSSRGLWVMTSCSAVVGYQPFRGPCCFHHHEVCGSMELWKVGILPQYYMTSQHKDFDLKHRPHESVKTRNIPRLLKLPPHSIGSPSSQLISYQYTYPWGMNILQYFSSLPLYLLVLLLLLSVIRSYSCLYSFTAFRKSHAAYHVACQPKAVRRTVN
jgi:hypothetical protein